MKILKVKIIDPRTLELEEKGDVGDRIDLEAIKNVDNNKILEEIKAARDEEYTRLIVEERRKFEAEKTIAILESEKKKEEEKQKAIDEWRDKLTEANSQIEELNRNKASLQVKNKGEDLEQWCNSEYAAYELTGGLENCKWYKDNIAVKDNDDSQKGTKADFIFEIYLDKNKNPADKLISVCCEMKTESPTTKNKQKNSTHYDKLDNDRFKKGCNYSLLVSELEWESLNDAPIRKISKYENMYMVRPSHFMTFLLLLKSLVGKYQDLMKQRILDDIEFQEKNEILVKFNDFKNTYIDKPLKELKEKVDEIAREAGKILTAAGSINKIAKELNNTSIETMKNNIEKFDIKGIAYKVASLTSKTI